MKKKIKGKVYNTSKSEEITHWTIGNYGEIDTHMETLYRANNDEFFLEIIYFHDAYEGVKSDIQLIPQNEIWLLLAERKVAPDCIHKFFLQAAQVVKNGDVIGLIRLF